MPEPVYRQRDPQSTPYYQCIEDHFETFEQVYEDRFERQYGFYRPYVKQVIYRYLDCGILHNGFARVRCQDCGHEYLLAFSCKRRHFCPSCHQKRVVEFGEWLCQEVVKAVPSPRRRLYPPACKPYGLEAEPEAARGGETNFLD